MVRWRRERASNPAGNSDWSDVWHFTCTSPEAIADAGQGKLNLEQNRPNPFLENTTIEFSLPVAGEITFEMTDLQGKVV